VKSIDNDELKTLVLHTLDLIVVRAVKISKEILKKRLKR